MESHKKNKHLWSLKKYNTESEHKKKEKKKRKNPYTNLEFLFPPTL